MADRDDDEETNDLGHVLFVAAIALVTGAYLWDVVTVSTHINNIILIVPLAFLLLILAAVLLVKNRNFRSRPEDHPAAPEEAEDAAKAGEAPVQTGEDIKRALIMLAGLGAYTLLYDIIGLDIATFAFVAGGLLLLGIRGRIFVPVFSAVFTVVIVGGADLLLHYPMYTVILP